ncbi:hypothetical protein LAUMK191_03845 [Mycobacterium attenuatum]|uniref:Uncharacterized protein n=1 Tax=Mycobacterium attenuatum TaxID=2341086 RepID=A0A498Q8R3_9MYCO|nr:hypothetical protein [Mycobacterium attenuatum]VBA41123.1 hypothetical protein LAUMK136_03869 [Mycobacterium attenuatum]VBA57075.1 hypothetical protein LAUMK191_03845 [Mycobacterium attenuatum]
MASFTTTAAQFGLPASTLTDNGAIYTIHHLSSHIIDPDKNYWRNQNKNPGRWPGNL